jgi:dUTP pyrophosphatase
MAQFEKVSKYKDDADLAMPIRKTAQSAGYDMVAAEDYIIPSIW